MQSKSLSQGGLGRHTGLQIFKAVNVIMCNHGGKAEEKQGTCLFHCNSVWEEW